jgi:hypothetical protein
MASVAFALHETNGRVFVICPHCEKIHDHDVSSTPRLIEINAACGEGRRYSIPTTMKSRNILSALRLYEYELQRKRTQYKRKKDSETAEKPKAKVIKAPTETEDPLEVNTTATSTVKKEPGTIVVVTAEEMVEKPDSKEPLSARRKKIPKAVRTLVWNLHIGSHKGEDRCMCCKEKKIDIANFHCGHVLAEANGGDLTLKNLRPICSACNSAMGKRCMNEFTKEFFGWEIT